MREFDDFFNEDNSRLGRYQKDEKGIFRSGNRGYWSNLDKEENREFLKLLDQVTPREAVHAMIPNLERMIFSEKREGALELLDVRNGDVCIDYGCMWGVLSIGMAKRGATVLSIDQTNDSLEFLCARKKHERLDTIIVVQDDIRKVDLKNLADFAIVNGVLEWVPEFGDIELKKYYGKSRSKDYPPVSPETVQSEFLRRVRANLREGGVLLLSIENRYDYTQFIGRRDPHSHLWFTSFLPRVLSDVISKTTLGRAYVNYLYSFSKLRKMLLDVGFKEVDLYMAFPNYRFPSLILPYKGGISRYRIHWHGRLSWRRKSAFAIEYGLMKILKARFLAPSIIAVATT